MKILQIIHKLQNRGAETFACQLSNHLETQGHIVKVATVYSGKADLPYKGKILTLDAFGSRRFLDWKAWYRLAGIIKEFKPDIVQANAGDTLKYVVFSKLVFRWTAPIVSRNASEVGRYLRSTVQRQLNAFLYKRVDRVISVSEASQKDILEHFPFLQGKTEVIPVGLERTDYITPADLQPSDSKHVVHVGGFSFEKNHQGLLRIFSEVLEAESTVQLHLIGDGPLRGEIEGKVREMKMSKNIKFYGFRDNPLSYIKAADVLVLPSIIEGLPGVLLEAMYCKTPVVAYNVGGISEIVNNNTGTLVEKNEEEKFSEAIIKSLVKPEKNKIEKAYQMVIKHFMNKSLALKFVNSYRKIVTDQQ